MLSVTGNTFNVIISSPFHNNTSIPTIHQPPSPNLKASLRPISATLIPSSTPPSNQQQQLYQPFRPPPSPLPSQFKSLDVVGRLDVLSSRLGLWFEYAPLIPSLYREGFTSPSIEEYTGISGVEQNRLVVAAQVRESLVQSNTDPDVVGEFDTGGAELLYELRLLNGTQRAAAARFIIQNRFDANGAQDLARAMKDYPRRRGDKGWEYFDYSLPGDCLSFMYYRQSREHSNPSGERTAALQQALEVAESEKAKAQVTKELEGDSENKEGKQYGIEDAVRVPVVRMRFGEVAEASSVVVLPVCRAEERETEILEAPWECKSVGDFGIVVSEKEWKRWVVLPRWQSVAGLANGVVVAFGDARALPWKTNRWFPHYQYYKDEYSLALLRQVTLSRESLMKHCFQYCDLNDSTCLRLNYLSLSRIGCFEKLLWVQMLDLSHNDLRSLEGMEALQLLSCLNLSYNKFSSFTALESLRQLKSLKVLNISYNQIGEHCVDLTRYLYSSPLSHSGGSEWRHDQIVTGGVLLPSYWEAYFVFRGLNLKQLDVVGNAIAHEKFKSFLFKILPTLRWLDGELC